VTREAIQVLCSCVLFLGSVGSSAQVRKSTKNETRINPVLLMEYDPSKVRYGQFPASFEHACAKLFNQETNQMIYAEVQVGDSVYLAEMGHYSDAERENSFNIGDIIWVQGNKCQPLGIDLTLSALPPKSGYRAATANQTFPGPDSPHECVPGQCHYVLRSADEEHILRGFVKDAIQRAITAYGGDASFRAQACKPEEEEELSEAGYIIVLQELRAYCSAPLGQR